MWVKASRSLLGRSCTFSLAKYLQIPLYCELLGKFPKWATLVCFFFIVSSPQMFFLRPSFLVSAFISFRIIYSIRFYSTSITYISLKEVLKSTQTYAVNMIPVLEEQIISCMSWNVLFMQPSFSLWMI